MLEREIEKARENMYDSKTMFELGYAFMNAGEANFREGVFENRSKYQNIAGVVNLAFACELFLKCLLNVEEEPFEKKHALSELWKMYADSCIDKAKELKNSVMAQIITDMSFEELLQSDSNVFYNYRYFYELDKIEEIRRNPVRPQFLRVLCFTLCGYAKEKTV